MSKKITAVQWMAKQILNLNKSDATWSEIYDQALFMEKEQIIDAYKEGCGDWISNDKIKGAQYYNETYGSK